MSSMRRREISLSDVVGGGYEEFWRTCVRYAVLKGSRASKKSTTAALKIITRMMQYPLANTLVVRKTASTLKDSCFAQLRWAIHRLGVDRFGSIAYLRWSLSISRPGRRYFSVAWMTA